MIAVGIDISKGKSTVALLNSDGSILAKLFEMKHTLDDMNAFTGYLKRIQEPIIILMGIYRTLSLSCVEKTSSRWLSSMLSKSISDEKVWRCRNS